MPKSPNSDAAPLTLYPPRLPRATDLGGGRFGIPKHIYDLEPMGLRVEVLPYIDQEPNDDVRLNLNDQPNIDSKQTQSTDDTVILHVPKAMLLPDIVNRLTYTVFRASNNRGTSEPPVELIYNRVRPGNEDRFPDIDGHSELELLLPDAIKNGVGPDFPVAGVPVCVSYPYCRAHDLIRLNLNGYDKFHTVTEQQAPLPGSDTPVQVCFNVTRADLAQGGDNARYSISYTVTDQLSNGADPDSPWSASQVVDVDLAGNRLPPPLLRERLNDPGDDTTIIDLEKLAGNPLMVVAVPTAPRFQIGDCVDAIYLARVTGQPDVRVETNGEIEGDEFGIFRPCVMQIPNDKVIPGSSVSVSFTLSRGGSVIANSRTASARVTAVAPIELQPPSIKEAPDNLTLNPVAAKDSLIAVVPRGELQPTDLLSVIFSGAPGTAPADSHTTPARLISETGLDIALPPAVLAGNLGKTVTVTYRVTRSGATLPDSRPLILNVGNLADQETALPTPTIEGSLADELDVEKLTGTENLFVTQWMFQRSGQRVWLRYDGIDKSGNATSEVVWEGPPHDWDQGLVTPAAVAWLKTLADASELNITFMVNFDGIANRATAVRFPVRRYTIKVAGDLKLEFTNAPYVITPMGRVKDIRLSVHEALQPKPNTELTLILPSGFTYADGGSGERTFRTDTQGTVSVGGVRGPRTPGTYRLEAKVAAERIEEELTVKALPKVGFIDGIISPALITIGPEGTRAYVAHSQQLTAIDTASFTRVFNLALNPSASKLAINPNGSQAYAIQRNIGVAVIDTQKGDLLGVLPVTNPSNIAFSPDGSLVYVCHPQANSVVVFESTTLSTVRIIPVEPNQQLIKISPDGARMYLGSGQTSKVSIVNTMTDRLITTISIEGEPIIFALSPDGLLLYVATDINGDIIAIDTIKGVIIKTFYITSKVYDLSFSPDGTRLYVMDPDAQNIAVINTITQQQAASITIEDYPYDTDVSPDSSRLYVCLEQDRIEVISLAR